jgi:hypothetical protein
MDFVKHQSRMKQDPVGAALDSHRFPLDSNMLVFLASGRVVRLSDAFSHGYAVTVNKLQGGEDKHIVLYIPGYQGEKFLIKYFSRNHLYTAITRATESFTFFGDSIKDLQQMILTDPIPHLCFLRLWIREIRRLKQVKSDAEARKKRKRRAEEDNGSSDEDSECSESEQPLAKHIKLDDFGFTLTRKRKTHTSSDQHGSSVPLPQDSKRIRKDPFVCSD